MIIDVHCHYGAEAGCIEKLLREMDLAGIDMACLTPLPPQFQAPDENAVLKAAKEHPDRFIPFGYIQLGLDTPEKVAALKAKGCQGLKMHIPFKNYNDESFFPIYAKAEECRMPILFHTGMIVLRTELDKKYHVDSSRMRPIYLDGVARSFPKLNMVGAHIGIPWHEEAAVTTRINPNMFVDLALGKSDGTQDYSPAYFRRLFNWPGAFKKLVFGGSHYSHVGWILQRRYLDTFVALGIDEETRELVLSGNIKKMLGMK
jgi:uncharacterized protein